MQQEGHAGSIRPLVMEVPFPAHPPGACSPNGDASDIKGVKAAKVLLGQVRLGQTLGPNRVEQRRKGYS